MNTRLRLYRSGGRRRLRLAGRTVILVDDGLASGWTARAAIDSIRRARARQVVLAVPVASRAGLELVTPKVDACVCLHRPVRFRYLSDVYDDFSPTSDKEVAEFLKRARSWRGAVERAIEVCRRPGGRITGNHVYAARLHDVRFRQLETGLPAQFQTPAEIKRQRKIHDKLIEKGLQLIADSFLDQLGKKCEAAGVALTRQLLEGINYEEIVNEVNRGAGRLPGLIGFDPNRAAGYDGGAKVRGDVQIGANGRLVAEEEDSAARLVGSSGRQYDLVAVGAHGLGRQPLSQLGGVVTRALRGIEKDMLLVRDDRPLAGGRFPGCVDRSSSSSMAMN